MVSFKSGDFLSDQTAGIRKLLPLRKIVVMSDLPNDMEALQRFLFPEGLLQYHAGLVC